MSAHDEVVACRKRISEDRRCSKLVGSDRPGQRRLRFEALEKRMLLDAGGWSEPDDPGQFHQDVIMPGDPERWHHDVIQAPAAWHSFGIPGIPGTAY